MALEFALFLPAEPSERWQLARQLGVSHVVAPLPFTIRGGHVAANQPGVPQPIVPPEVPPPDHRPWDFMPL
ncbi:MAG: mannonate dehydratase, partial [Thermorudis peleae]|nr:mannonate dehydratase [Thermorudis peleae]